jgi:hypothetical protein
MSDKLKPTPDQLAAQQLLAELRTRISTQPLPYQYGRATRALESMWQLFVQARESIKGNPGCCRLASRTTEILNLVVRPLTAKWDQAYQEGRLDSRDGSDEFRGDLLIVQKRLREFAAELHEIAYGEPHVDALTPPPMSRDEVDALFRPLDFGFVAPKANLRVRANDIAHDELASVTARREKFGIATDAGNNAIGLALSGGGIRSATFSLGAIQVLADKGFLKEIDFLSTVSGGGYVGSFLTRQLGSGAEWKDVAAPYGPDTEPIRRLRQRAKFLTARNLWDAWGKVTATVAGMLMNWMVPLLVLVVLAALTVQFKGLEHGWVFWKWPAIVGMSLSIITGVAYFGLLRAGSVWANRSGWCLAVSVALGLLALAALGISSIYVALFLGNGHQPANTHQPVSGAVQSTPSWLGVTGLSLGGVAALIPVILRYIPLLEAPKVRRVVIRIALYVAGIFMPLLGITVFLLLYNAGGVPEITWLSFAGHVSGAQALWIFAALLTLLAIFFLNINLTGPHRLYRNALSKAFIERDQNKDVDFALAEVNTEDRAPYHLLNAALNLPSSKDPSLRDRKCDFFFFSKHWSGSPVVGYQRTKAWKMNGKPADLATAMAISGAAFSANMGLGSIAPLRALLAFLNVRLGFWIRKPRIGGLWGLPKWKHAGFMCLLREMGGFGMAEHHRWLNLSDGGHIENLGVYELLRRRCKFIICVDGESDPDFAFHGLMTLVRHAQIDFGVRIEPRLDDLRPDPKTGYSKSHFHFCRIHYPQVTFSGKTTPEGTGLLLYIKLSVTGNETGLIKRYRMNNSAFPHQTTLDQFFDQEQFEAYRQLGVHVAEGLFLPALMNQTSPKSVPKWFRQLAENLLERDRP